MTNIEFPSRRKLLDAALEHLALERSAACLLRVPNTDPPLFVAVGTASTIVQWLQDAIHEARQPVALGHVQFDDSEGGHHD